MNIINQRTELVPIDSVQPHPRNANRGDLGAIHSSLDAHGFYGTIVAQESSGRVLAGNHRWQAMKQAGATEIPVTFVDVDDETALRILLVDNKTTRDGISDSNALAELLQELAATPSGLNGSGYDGDALDELLADLGQMQPELQGDPDAVPAVPEEPVSRLGDLWLLGRHRLLCGDAAHEVAHQRVLDGDPVDLVLTDPPYGIGIQYATYDDTPQNLAPLIERVMPLLMRWPVVLLTPGVPHMWLYPRPSWVLAWVHPAPSGSGPWGWQGFNPILAYGADPKLAAGQGRHPDSCVMGADRQGEDGHPTPKPAAVWSWLLERGTNKAGAHVFDPFAGSGTGIVAAERLGHRCSAIELDPGYCDVTVRRWEEYTGRTAVREPATAPASVEAPDHARVLTG